MKKALALSFYYFFPIFLAFLELSFYLRTYDSCQIKITALHVGGTIILALWLLKILEEGRFPFIKKQYIFLVPIIIFFISGFVSFLHSPFKFTSFEELIRRFFYMFFFFLMIAEFHSLERVKSIVKWVIFIVFVSCLYGFIQALDLDPWVWRRAFGNRIFSCYGNPNFYGAFLVISAPILITEFLRTKNKFYAFVYIILAINVFLTRSKGAYIGLAAGTSLTVIMSSLFLSQAKRKNIKRFLIGFISGLVILTFLSVGYLTVKNIDSIRFRLFTWLSTCQMILKKPFFGSGIGTFKIVYPLYRRPEIFHIEGKHNTETDHPEDEYLEIWFDEGIIGLGIFLWLLFFYFSSAFRRLKASFWELSEKGERRKATTARLQFLDTQQYYIVGIGCGIFGMLVHNAVGVNMRFVSSGTIFWTFMGLLVSQITPFNEINKEKEISRIPFLKVIQLGVIVLAIIGVTQFMRLFYADFHHNKAIAYSKAKMWEEAIAEYRKVLKYNPYFIMAHYFMGNVFNDRWNMQKVYNPDWTDTNHNARDDAERALAKYSDVKKLAPNYVQVHFQEGVVYLKLGKWEKAIEDFKKAHMLDPVFPLTYFKLAWAYIQLHKFSEAEKVYKEAIKWHPDNIQVYLNLANVYYIQKKNKEAEQTYKRILSFNPNNFPALKNLAILYFKTNQKELSKRYFYKALALNPNDKEIQKILKTFK